MPHVWFGVQLCALGENRSELYGDRCDSLFYRNIPSSGLVVLGLGIAAAKLSGTRWPAWAALPLALIPSLLTWNLFSV